RRVNLTTHCRGSPGDMLLFFSDFHSFPRSLLVHRSRGEKTARNVDLARARWPPPALKAMGKFVQKSTQDGILVDAGGLLPTADGVRVRLKRPRVTSQPGCSRAARPRRALRTAAPPLRQRRPRSR